MYFLILFNVFREIVFETGFTIFFVPSPLLNVLLLNSPKFWENLTNPLLAGIQAEVEEVCFDNLCLLVSICNAKAFECKNEG